MVYLIIYIFAPETNLTVPFLPGYAISAGPGPGKNGPGGQPSSEIFQPPLRRAVSPSELDTIPIRESLYVENGKLLCYHFLT